MWAVQSQSLGTADSYLEVRPQAHMHPGKVYDRILSVDKAVSLGRCN